MQRIRFFFRYLLKDTPWDTGISPPELMDFIAAHAPGRALDMGCGTGTNAITLAQHGWEVHAIDFAAPAIRTARRKAQRAGVQVHFYHRSVTQTADLPAPFDLVLDIGCYHALSRPDQRAYAHNLARLLAPGGTLLLYAHLYPPDGNASHGLDDEGLRLLQTHLRLVQRVEGSGRKNRASVWLTLQR